MFDCILCKCNDMKWLLNINFSCGKDEIVVFWIRLGGLTFDSKKICNLNPEYRDSAAQHSSLAVTIKFFEFLMPVYWRTYKKLVKWIFHFKIVLTFIFLWKNLFSEPLLPLGYPVLPPSTAIHRPCFYRLEFHSL